MNNEKSELLELVRKLKTELFENQNYELASRVRELEKGVEEAFEETTPESFVVKFNDEEHLEEFLMNLRIQQPELFKKFIAQYENKTSI